MLMMNLEVRPVVFEDIGRQVLAGSKRRTAQFYYDEIGECRAFVRTSKTEIEHGFVFVFFKLRLNIVSVLPFSIVVNFLSN